MFPLETQTLPLCGIIWQHRLYIWENKAYDAETFCYWANPTATVPMRPAVEGSGAGLWAPVCKQKKGASLERLLWLLYPGHQTRWVKGSKKRGIRISGLWFGSSLKWEAKQHKHLSEKCTHKHCLCYECSSLVPRSVQATVWTVLQTSYRLLKPGLKEKGIIAINCCLEPLNIHCLRKTCLQNLAVTLEIVLSISQWWL